MKLLTNPLFIRMAAVFLCSVAAFVIGVVAMRILRRRIVEDGGTAEGPHSEHALPLEAYAVIQQLKQQKFALQNEQQTERRRAKTSEHISAAILGKLPCGMLFVAPSGLVRQANAAARQILGFASPMGMSVRELFRDSRVIGESGSSTTLAEVFESLLHGKAAADQLESSYLTPTGREHALRFTLVPVHGEDGNLIGLASLISDESEMANLRQARILHAEISAEMALELRTSLSTIREWVQQMAVARDAKGTQGFVRDISAETERLEQKVGSFLAGHEKVRAAQA